MQPLVNTCMTTLSEGRIGCIWWFVCPFCDPCCPVYTASHLIMWRTKGKKLWNWATKSPCSRLDPGGFLLLEAIQVWAGPKDMVFNPFACEIGKRFPRFWKNRLNVKQDSVLLCLVPGLYLFYSILLLVYCLFIYLFIYLSIYCFFFFIRLLWTAV